MSLIALITVSQAMAVTYSVSPTGWTSKPSSNITINGTTYIAATTQGIYISIKAEVNSDNSVTFYVKKSSGTFENKANVILYKDLNGSNQKIVASGSISAGSSQGSLGSFTPDFTSGSYKYTALLLSNGIYFCTRDITITAGSSQTTPAKPSSPNPSDGATNVSTSLSTLRWTSSGAVSSDVWISDNLGSLGNQTALSGSGSSCSISSLNLKANTTYYWTVVVYDSNNNHSQSDVWEFTTGDSATPAKPSSPNPSDEATNVSTSLSTLRWTSSGAVSSNVWISDNLGSLGNQTALSGSGTSCSISSLNLKANTTYYWTVVVYDSNNNHKQSDIWNFTTGESTTPVKPSNPNPADGATNVSTGLSTLQWASSGAVSSDVWISDNLGTLSNQTAISGSGTSCSISSLNLKSNTTYYWTVVVYDSNNNHKQSDIWHFTTTSMPVGDCTFPDLPTTNDFYEPTCYLYNLGVISGSDQNGAMQVENPITRGQLAKAAFRGVYSIKGRDVDNATIPSDNFPIIYEDLINTNQDYSRAARALLYLEYGDGVAPFDRDRVYFAQAENITRLHTLKVLMETFNIQPNVTGTNNPFPSDADVVSIASKNPVMMGYIRKAVSLGIITTTQGTFRPNDNCKRGEAFTMLARIMQKVDNGVTDPNPNPGDYFQPLNTTLQTISLGLGLPLGNFNHYTKSSFALGGTVPLVFQHTYNSYSTTYPEVFYGSKNVNGAIETYQPLGDGWSHSFHTFISVVGSPSDGTMRALVHWGGGKIDVYKSNGSAFVPQSMGVYDEFSLQTSTSSIVIKTKNQITYTFSHMSSSGANVYYLSNAKDRNGNTMTLNYETGINGSKRISSVSDGNRSLTFSYKSGTNLLEKVSDPLGRSIKFSYDYNDNTGRYRLSTFTDAKNQVTSYEYGDATKLSTSKLLTRIQLPKGNYIENEYDANRRLTHTENGTAQTDVTVQPQYGSSMSTKSQVNVMRGGSTSTYNYTYNSNNVVTGMTGNQGIYMNSTYGNSSHPELPTAVSTNVTNISNVTYDSKGNVTKIVVTGDGTLTTTMTYDNMNNLTSVTDPMNNKTTYTYDSKGNLVGISAPESVTSSITVDSKGQPTQVTNPMGVQTQFQYNSYGNVTKMTLPALSLSSSMSYDAASRLTSSTDALNRTSSFSYDKNDNLFRSTDPAYNKTTYEYDENDNLTGITNAKDGVTSMTYDNATDWLTSVSFAGSTKSYTYNDDGTINTFTKPDGNTLSYSYDDLGRITSDGVNSYNYDSKMRLSSVSGNGKTINYSYDGFNRVTGTSYNGYSNTYSYDKNGNCLSINNATYGYDGLNRLTSVSFSGKTITYTYRKDSQLQKVTYPNGMTTEYGYDAVGRLTSKTTKLNGTVIAGYSYTLDKVGNITSQTTQEPYSNMLLTNENTSYTYNSGNRITKAGDISFSFDANGNTTKRGSEAYVWDDLDRLTRAGSTAIEYDPLGLIAKYGDITFTTDPLGMGNVLSDSKSGAQYIYGNGLEARVKNGVVSYYVTDMRGSVVAIVDNNGNVTHKYQYDEFGKVTQKQEADYNPFQYVGKYGVMYLNDHQYYMRARHYDPTIGRFLSEDPIWSTNLYPYASNNPIMKIDADGRADENIDEWLEKMLEKIDDSPQPVDQSQLSQDMFNDMVNGKAFVGGTAKPAAGNAKINYLEHIPYNTIKTTYKEVKNWGKGQTLAHVGNIAKAISKDGVSSVVKLTYHGPFRDELADGAEWAVSKSIEGYGMLVDVTLGDAMDRYYMKKYNKNK